MPVTRSITRTRAATTPPLVNLKRAPNKRQLEEEAEGLTESDPAVIKRIKRVQSSSKSKKSKSKPDAAGAVPRPLVKPSGEDLAPLPAKLTFSLEDAKSHLVKADRRFGNVFARMPCKPFERLEGVHPFRSVRFLSFFPGSSHRTAWGWTFDYVSYFFDAERCALP
jgi:DNA-3-methyladenine glycosylase II